MTEPRWLSEARKYIGTSEIPGSKNNPVLMRILDLADGIKDGKTIGAFDDDEAWCAKYVSAVLELVKIRSARSAWAQMYKTYAQELKAPAVGAIVVFWREKPTSTKGHVGFVVGRDKNDNLMVLGGNQGDEVSVKPFAPHRVLAYRWPPGEPLPTTGWGTLPLLNSDGKPSENEA